MSFFDCAQCTKVSDCATCGCLPVTLGGLVNTTVVKDDLVPANDRVIWVWHLQIENCSNKPLCVSVASLTPRWKYTLAVDFNNSVFQPFLNGFFPPRQIEITSTIPDFVPFTPSNAWIEGNLNQNTFVLPPGKYFIDISLQVLQSFINQITGSNDCGHIALFPSPFSVTLRPQRNAACAQTITVDVGCNPDAISIETPAPVLS